MKKEKRMSKVLLIIVVILLLIAVVAVVVFIMGSSHQLAREDLPIKNVPMNITANKGETDEIMENQDYVENQVVAVADSKREAKKIAKAIGGTLLSYDNQVAVIQIGITVEEMMQKLEEDSSLPKVYTNYQNYQNYSY